ncbi:unnamed protein product [Lota lota]
MRSAAEIPVVPQRPRSPSNASPFTVERKGRRASDDDDDDVYFFFTHPPKPSSGCLAMDWIQGLIGRTKALEFVTALFEYARVLQVDKAKSSRDVSPKTTPSQQHREVLQTSQPSASPPPAQPLALQRHAVQRDTIKAQICAMDGSLPEDQPSPPSVPRRKGKVTKTSQDPSHKIQKTTAPLTPLPWVFGNTMATGK